MKKIVEQFFCDICGKQSEVTKIKYPVVFYTEQTEGRSCKPYIDYQEIDMCAECQDKVLRLKGFGAQGYNDYKIKE